MASSSSSTHGREALIELLTPETYLPPASAAQAPRVVVVTKSDDVTLGDQSSSNSNPLMQRILSSSSNGGQVSNGGAVKRAFGLHTLLILGMLALAVLGLLMAFRYLNRKVQSLARSVEAKSRPSLTVDQLEDIRKTILSEVDNKTDGKLEEIRRVVEANSAAVAQLQQMLQQLAFLQVAAMNQGVQEEDASGAPEDDDDRRAATGSGGDEQGICSEEDEVCFRVREHPGKSEAGAHDEVFPEDVAQAFFANAASNPFFHGTGVVLIPTSQSASSSSSSSNYTVTPIEDDEEETKLAGKASPAQVGNKDSAVPTTPTPTSSSENSNSKPASPAAERASGPKAPAEEESVKPATPSNNARNNSGGKRSASRKR